MASSTLVPQFVKYLCVDDCSSNEMRVPIKFCHSYGNRVHDTVMLNIRNGYKIMVTFDRNNYKFVGMLDLFMDYGLMGGQVLVFEFFDKSNLIVYIIGHHGSEIQYPNIVHASQTSSPTIVCPNIAGWKFVKFMNLGKDFFDQLVAPRSFVRQFGQQLPANVKYVLNNGLQFDGHYERQSRTLGGFRDIMEALTLQNFRSFDMLVLTYDAGQCFNVAFFDGRNVEIVFQNQVLASGTLSFSQRYPSHFAILVKPFHMLPYCHGVDIFVVYNRLFVFWKNTHHITVFKDNHSWPLEIRKCRQGKRTSIHDGWIQFRDDLQLDVGDTCWFKWNDESYERFTVEVAKAVYVTG